MPGYKLSGPLSTRLMLLIPTYEDVLGVPKPTFPDMDKGIVINGTFRTFGGTEMDFNGIYSVEKTATIETWYRPDITSGCRIGIPETGEIYEIFGEPEDISMRHQFLKIRVRQYKGKNAPETATDGPETGEGTNV